MQAEIAALVQSAIDTVKPILPLIAVGAAGSAAWDAQKAVWTWIRNKLSGSARPQIIEGIELDPADDSRWEELSAALAGLLAKQPDLTSELAGLLRSTECSQVASVGSNSQVVQQIGQNNSVHIGK